MTDIVDIGLAVDSRPVDKGREALDRFGRQSKTTQTATDHLNNSLRSMRRWLLSIISLQALRKIAEDVDNLAKTSRKLGLTTQALAGLHEAARVSGISISTMDMAMQRLVRRMAEAAKGGGEALQAIRDLGLDATQLSQLPLDQQMLAVAKAFEGVKDSGEQVRLAFKLFDSEGVAVVNTLRLQESGLKAAAERAKQYGTAVSAVDAKKIETMNDAVGALWERMKGLGTTLEITFAPLVTGLANGLGWAIDKIKELANWYKKLVDFSFEADKAILMMMTDWDGGLQRLKTAWSAFMAETKGEDGQGLTIEINHGKTLHGLELLAQGFREVWTRIKYDATHQSTQMTGNILKDLQTMTAGVAGNSKKMFQIQKTAALAEAIVNAPAAITQAFKAYPPPFSFIMAGVQAAAVAAQIAAIRSSSFGGGGGGGASVGGGGGGAATAAAPIPVPTQQQVHAQPTALTITHNWNIQSLDGTEWIDQNKGKLAAAVEADLNAQGRSLP